MMRAALTKAGLVFRPLNPALRDVTKRLNNQVGRELAENFGDTGIAPARVVQRAMELGCLRMEPF